MMGPRRPGPLAGSDPSPARVASTYDFHGLYRVRVEHRGLDALMRQELGVFLSDRDAADLTIEEGPVPRPAKSLAEDYRFDDSGFVVETGSGRLAIQEGRILAEPRVNPYELLAHWVENLMKIAIVRRGVCFVHSAAVSRDGAATLLPAWMGSGKTHLLLHALAHGYDFMADDWCFVSESGETLGYPRWPALVYHHFEANPALRELLASGPSGASLRRRLAVSEFAGSLRPAGPIGRRFRRFLEDRFFVTVHPGPTRLFPAARCVLRAKAARVALLLASERSEVEVRPLPPEELARRSVWAGTYERNRYSTHRLAMAYAGKDVPLADTTAEETDLLTRAFRTARCFEVVLPSRPTPADLDGVLAEIERV